MATPSYARSLIHLTKRLRLSPPSQALIAQCPARNFTSASKCPSPSISPEQAEKELLNVRLPRAVQAAYLTPLRRTPTHKHPVCDLQLRSYSVRNLEAFTDFALRAAYFLHLAARGPVPLPRITSRWTVPRSNFVHKKSQENFERITLRRLIQIQDGHPEVVAAWLAFLKKHQYYGIGMKANVFEHSGLNTTDDLDAAGREIQERLAGELEGKIEQLRPAGKGAKGAEREAEASKASEAQKPAAKTKSTPVKPSEINSNAVAS